MADPSGAGDAVAREVVVTGRVQGVWFRDSTSREATRLGVAGWVRNEPDGTVRAHLEGAADSVQELITFLHAGPERARVDAVEVSEGEMTGMSTFRVR